MAGFGGSVKLTGESSYRQALKNISQSLKEVSSELKLVSSQYKSNDTSLSSLKGKQEALNKVLEKQETDLKAATTAYNNFKTKVEEQATAHEQLKEEYENAKAELENIGETLGETSEEYDAQAEVVAELTNKLNSSETAQNENENALSKLKTSLNNAETAYNNTANEVEELTKEIEAAESPTDTLGDSVDDLAGNLSDAEKPADDLGDSLKDAGNEAEGAEGGFTVFKAALADLIANVVANAINKMKELVSETIEVGANFEKSMSNVAAISGATDEELTKLSETAQQFGSTTQFSASEAADALSYMSLAGWDADTSISALGGVLDLAAASGMDLASASDMVTNYLSAFNMTADESQYFADLLAYAQGNANTSAEQLGDAFKNCAANMSAAGQDIETTTSLISMLSNQGLQGSEAGTALSAVMRDLTSKMENGKVMIGKTAVSVQDAQGNFRDLTDILADVESATDGMGTAQKAAALQSTFTSDSIKGLNLILSAGVDEAAGFEDQLRSCSGTASDMAAVMNDNLNGDMTALNSQIEGVQIALYQKFEPALRAGVDVLSSLVDGLSTLVDHSTEVIAVLAAIATGVATYIGYTTALKVMEEGWASLTIVTKAQAVAQAALNAVMSANPIGIVIALIAALVAAFVILWNKSEGFRNFFIGMWAAIKEVVGEAWENIKSYFSDAWESIKDTWSAVSGWFNDKVIMPIKVFFIGTWLIVSTAAKTAWDTIKSIWSAVSGWFNDKVITPIKVFFIGTWLIVSNAAKTAWDTIKNVWSAVSGWFDTNIITPVKTYFTNLWDNLKTGASTAWENVKTVFNSVTSWFSETFTAAWTAVKNVFSSWGSFFSGLWDNIKTTFSNLGTSIANAISSSVKSGINGVISSIESTINSAIGLINGAIGLINKLPGVSVSTVSKLSLPRLAEGGIVDSPTIAEIGEAGKEAIIPLENNTGWISKVAAQIAQTLETPLIGLSDSLRDIKTPQTSNYNYNTIVDAFKDALAQMKVVLDDEEMGNFIEKTVADAIFS